MPSPIRRFYSILTVMVVALAVVVPQGRALAQAADDVSYIGAIKGNDVYVRCGAAESYYPFTKVAAGDLIKVTGEKFDWVRVSIVGPAFRNATGYIKYAKGDTGRLRVAADGKTGVTLGKTDIVAPNLDAQNSIKESWKAIVRIEPDQTLHIIKTTETDIDVIHTVALPEAAQGWISKAYIERASDTQVAQWNNPGAAAAAEQPKSRTTGKKPSEASPAGKDVVPVKNNANAPVMASPTTPGLTDDEVPIAPATTPVAGASVEGAPAVETPVIKPVEKAPPTLEELESAFRALQQEPIETAEVMPLRNLYLDLAKRLPMDTRVQRYSKNRSEQLLVWTDLQKKKQELLAVRAKAKLTAEDFETVRMALESSAQYIAVGRIVASTIYDGERLPKLLRIQDAASGRTVAYLKPDEAYELANLIGNVVGIHGDKTFDEALRLNIVAPRRIDVLTPEDQRTVEEPVVADKPVAQPPLARQPLVEEVKPAPQSTPTPEK